MGFSRQNRLKTPVDIAYCQFSTTPIAAATVAASLLPRGLEYARRKAVLGQRQ